MEPVSTIALSAAIGAAATKFIDRAWNIGEKWLQTYLKDHHQKAINVGKDNAISFLSKLAVKIDELNKDKKLTEDRLTKVLENPDFSVLLQKAIISATQTNEQTKHELLSMLVSNRIISDSETTYSLASKMACDVISFTNKRQLYMLGLITAVSGITPNKIPDENQLQKWGVEYLESLLNPYNNLQVIDLDLVHLEALSCLIYPSLTIRYFKQLVKGRFGENNSFNVDEFINTDTGNWISTIWNNSGLKSVKLTSVGLMLGVIVSDTLTGKKTDFLGWE